MLTAYETRLIKEISDNKKNYLIMAHGSEKNSEISELYDRFSSVFSNYYSNLVDDTWNRMGYQNALKTHKVDPFIAGGIGQGIGGVGAGIYAAANTASNNAEIDANRAYYEHEVSNSSRSLSSSESSLLSITRQLDSVLDSVSSIKEYREKEKEKLYLEAKELCQKGILDTESAKKAQIIFDSLGDYKDSITMARECCDRERKSNELVIALASAVLGLFFAVTTGGLENPGFGIFVFLLIFIHKINIIP